ncbi:hypothetical protein ACFSUS_00070 [Spirosoma soli]|uniref:DUF2306 domain-containing protein n=1 Tax=Spirosoma soli TaxID=1770529 RepID=A0ABW5LW32_9BACT
MNSILHSSVSVVHLLAALTAMLTGTYILFTEKGTIKHRIIGRIYVAAMVVLLLTAFQIYFLFGRFGVIHWGAVGSVLALTVGTASVGLRQIVPSWLRWHYIGMGASVTGLYAAFLVESTYRFFPPSYFWWVTMGSANAVFAVGAILLYRYYPRTFIQKSRLTESTGFIGPAGLLARLNRQFVRK